MKILVSEKLNYTLNTSGWTLEWDEDDCELIIIPTLKNPHSGIVRILIDNEGKLMSAVRNRTIPEEVAPIVLRFMRKAFKDAKEHNLRIGEHQTWNREIELEEEKND